MAIETPLLHPAVLGVMERLRQNLPQSLLIHGEQGIGLKTTAHWLAGSADHILIQPTDSKRNIDESGGSISVETIRELYDTTRSKRHSNLVVIIDNADRMSHGAQSAFLKLLEEPNTHTKFILTSHAAAKLLATIRSRVWSQHIQPLTPQQTSEFIASLGVTDARKKMQLEFLANGLPAELQRLVSSDEYFDARAKILQDARTLLQGTPYNQLLLAQKYRSDRQSAIKLIDGMLAILQRSLRAQGEPKLIQKIEQLLAIRTRIEGNANIALQLSRLALQ